MYIKREYINIYHFIIRVTTIGFSNKGKLFLHFLKAENISVCLNMRV